MFKVGRSAFLLIQRHEFHPAFRTISGMITDDFGMHRAGVFLHARVSVRLVVIVFVVRVIDLKRPYLSTCCECDQRNCARD